MSKKNSRVERRQGAMTMIAEGQCYLPIVMSWFLKNPRVADLTD